MLLVLMLLRHDYITTHFSLAMTDVTLTRLVYVKQNGLEEYKTILASPDSDETRGKSTKHLEDRNDDVDDSDAHTIIAISGEDDSSSPDPSDNENEVSEAPLQVDDNENEVAEAPLQVDGTGK